MDGQIPENLGDLQLAETPEDVAVLYSWANLKGAKYRDFSASRREYRAQMRHRAAEAQREAEMRAKAEAEAAAAEAEKAAGEAEDAAKFHESEAKRASEERRRTESEMQEQARDRARRHAAELSRRAAAERSEAGRRAEAVAAAEAAARKEARELAEAQISAQRQAARYAESEILRRNLTGPQPEAYLPGQISDPYTDEQPHEIPGRLFHQPVVTEEDLLPTRLPRSRQSRPLLPEPEPIGVEDSDFWMSTGRNTAPFREGTPETPDVEPLLDSDVTSRTPAGYSYEPNSQERVAAVDQYAQYAQYAPFGEAVAQPAPMAPSVMAPPVAPVPDRARDQRYAEATEAARKADARAALPVRARGYKPDVASGVFPQRGAAAEPAPAEAGRERGTAPAWLYPESPKASAQPLPVTSYPQPEPARTYPQPEAPKLALQPEAPRLYQQPEPPRFYPQPEPPKFYAPHAEGGRGADSSPRRRVAVPASPAQDTLQGSRERVAARWFALKGVFESAAPEPQPDPALQRQKETRVPLLTVFSMAGGVGKTSLVATLGRALSANGESVLLADTTSHGLLPFYFGASELRPGVVRTFSPPPGSPNAPIALVSYDTVGKDADAAAGEWLVDELSRASRGMQRVLLDLGPASGWVARKLARLNSVVIVPVSPDMNSVISLGPVEKFFAGMVDGEGGPVQPFYLLNGFDTSLPLHLDVREVMRQQLGDRLLPFVVRRSPSVSEALAEGMTVLDYAPDAPVATDYGNLATWLRTQSAPATTGFKNSRWSER